MTGIWSHVLFDEAKTCFASFQNHIFFHNSLIFLKTYSLRFIVGGACFSLHNNYRNEKFGAKSMLIMKFGF